MFPYIRKGGKIVANAPMIIDRIIEEDEAKNILILGLNFGYHVGIILDNHAIVRHNLMEWGNDRIVVALPPNIEVKNSHVKDS